MIAVGYRGELTINGQVHLRARDYDARSGTFTKRDAVDGRNGRPTLANRYHYADNDPLNRVDPTGHTSTTDCQFQDVQDSLGTMVTNLRNAGFDRQAEAFERLHDPSFCGIFEFGDDKVVEAFGTLRTSSHVLVYVAASGASIENYPDGFRGDAAGYALRAKGQGGGLTSIAWLGYSTPNIGVINAPFHDASEGGERLKAFVDMLKAKGKIVTVLAPSFASRVAESAVLEFGARPDNVVYLGGLVAGDSIKHHTRAWSSINNSDWEARGGGNLTEDAYDCSGTCTRLAGGAGQHDYGDDLTHRNVLDIAMGRCDQVQTYDGEKPAPCA